MCTLTWRHPVRYYLNACISLALSSVTCQKNITSKHITVEKKSTQIHHMIWPKKKVCAICGRAHNKWILTIHCFVYFTVLATFAHVPTVFFSSLLSIIHLLLRLCAWIVLSNFRNRNFILVMILVVWRCHTKRRRR